MTAMTIVSMKDTTNPTETETPVMSGRSILLDLNTTVTAVI